jgi:hypothetical protein
MYRNISKVEFAYGHWNDGMECAEELNRLCAERGMRQARLLLPTFGRANVLISEVEYDSLAQLEDEQNRFFSDAEIMKVIRRMSQFTVQGSARDELVQDAVRIA